MSTSVDVSELSELTIPEAESLVGKTIIRVAASEYGLVLTLSDGLLLSVRGHQYSDCALGIDVDRIPA